MCARKACERVLGTVPNITVNITFLLSHASLRAFVLKNRDNDANIALFQFNASIVNIPTSQDNSLLNVKQGTLLSMTNEMTENDTKLLQYTAVVYKTHVIYMNPPRARRGFRLLHRYMNSRVGYVLEKKHNVVSIGKVPSDVAV